MHNNKVWNRFLFTRSHSINSFTPRPWLVLVPAAELFTTALPPWHWPRECVRVRALYYAWGKEIHEHSCNTMTSWINASLLWVSGGRTRLHPWKTSLFLASFNRPLRESVGGGERIFRDNSLSWGRCRDNSCSRIENPLTKALQSS